MQSTVKTVKHFLSLVMEVWVTNRVSVDFPHLKFGVAGPKGPGAFG